MIAWVRRAACAALLVGACGGDDDTPPPGVGTPAAGGGAAGARGGTAGTTSGRGGSEGGDGGLAGGEAGRGGTSDSGGQAGQSTPGGASGTGAVGGTGPVIEPCDTDEPSPPPAIDSVCDPSAVWASPEAVVPNPNETDQLIATTPDELTIVWYRAGGAAGFYLVADRPSASSAFSAPLMIDAATLLTLSPDGLRLVALSDERDGFVELVRSARGQAFGAPEPGQFAVINAALAGDAATPSGALISPDDRVLYYTVSADAGIEYPVRVSARASAEPWPVGTALEGCEFRAQAALSRVPTGVSSDGLTLFYYDAARGTSRAAFREAPGEPFSWFRDLGNIARAQPNLDCDRLYYATFAEDSGIFVATAE